MTYTAEQQKSIRAIETTDDIASNCVIKEKQSRTLLREAHFSEALCPCECPKKSRQTGDNWGPRTND